MGRLEFRQIEGLLYGLGGPPEPNVAHASLSALRSRPGPAAPMRQLAGRIEVARAAQSLSLEDWTVLREHYVLRRPQPGAVRRRAIRALRVVLDSH